MAFVAQSPLMHAIRSAITKRPNLRKLLFGGLVAPAALSSLLLVGCSLSEDGKTDNPKIATTQVQSYSGAGSTFVAPLFSQWTDVYGKAHQVQINYQAIGSGAGITQLKEGNPTFAASDAPLDNDQLKGMPAILQIPVTAGPVCVIYNVPGLSTPLRLSGKTLAGIFSGDIINWQDSAIASENPGVKLPHAAIIVVHRTDGSGTTSIFTSFLSSVSPDWAKRFGRALTLKWPAGIGEQGSTNVMNTVEQNPGTIGYLELSYAKDSGLPVASIQNKAGEYVAPTPKSAYLAVTAFNDALAKDLRTPVVDPPATAKEAYPVSGFTYVLIPKDDSVLGNRQAFKEFMEYAVSSGQDVAEQLSYARLPAPIEQQSQGLLSKMTDFGQPLK